MAKVIKVKRVFISHGHNEVAKLKLKDFLKERLAMEPIILADQPDQGLTVVEKLVEQLGSHLKNKVLTMEDYGIKMST